MLLNFTHNEMLCMLTKDIASICQCIYIDSKLNFNVESAIVFYVANFR